MTADPTLLVLGVGGNVSQGILKSLALGRLDCRVVGACTSARAMGLYTVDKAYVSPLASDGAFLEWLLEVCRREAIDGILSGVEPVLQVLAPHAAAIRRETGATVVVSPPAVLAIGDDKLVTGRWLREHGLAAPRSAPAEESMAAARLGRECGYPLIAKPRAGKSSSGIFRIEDEEQLARVRDRQGYLVQEHLGESTQEYTAATLTDRQGRVRGCIVLHRELQSGTTYRAEAGEFPAVRREAIRIAEALEPLGPCNMQFRLRGDRPVCFEINARFSGTAPIRARLGFNDVEAAVRHLILGEESVELPAITRGVALRYWNELYVDVEDAAALAREGVLERPDGRVEDYGV